MLSCVLISLAMAQVKVTGEGFNPEDTLNVHDETVNVTTGMKPNQYEEETYGQNVVNDGNSTLKYTEEVPVHYASDDFADEFASDVVAEDEEPSRPPRMYFQALDYDPEGADPDLYSTSIQTGTYLVGRGRFLYLDVYGALLDNNGFVYNRKISATPVKRVLELEPNGNVYLKDAEGNIVEAILEKDTPTEGVVHSLRIDSNGNVVTEDGSVLFDLSMNGPSIDQTYLPIMSSGAQSCVEYADGKLQMGTCTVEFPQMFSLNGDKIRILADPKMCVVSSESGLAVQPCEKASSKSIFTHMKSDGTIRTKENKCFKVNGSELVLDDCSLWQTDSQSFTYTFVNLNPPSMEYSKLFNHDKSAAISSSSNGWLEADQSKVDPLILSSENDSVKWALDSAGKLHFGASPAFCMDTADGIKPVICENASTWKYANGRLMDDSETNCLWQNGNSLAFSKCDKVQPKLAQFSFEQTA